MRIYRIAEITNSKVYFATLQGLNHKKFHPQKMIHCFYFQMIVEYGMEDTELSPPVAELMRHIWQEAGGEIEDVLSSPLQSLKLDQVSTFISFNDF
jgi:hypothetical protein